jgi:hypothetical protein
MSEAIKNCNAGEGCHVMFILLEELAKNPVWLIPLAVLVYFVHRHNQKIRDREEGEK